MKVALAVVLRDEVDVVEAHLEHHAAVGVDVVLATDHGSSDGTTEILERYASGGFVRLFRGEGPYNRQGEWMTRMARLAATELAVDWVLCGDGDEFWWPRGGSIKDVLGGVPGRYGSLRVLSQSFVLLPEDERSFAERMTVRYSPLAAVSDPSTPYRPVTKVAHRAAPNVVVADGNHDVRGVPGAVLGAQVPLEILHFPLRSTAQTERKYRKTAHAWQSNPRGDLARARALSIERGSGAFHRRLVVSDDALRRGLETGVLVRDTRLRDARRAARDWQAGINVRHPFEAGVLAEAEAVRLQRRIDQLELSVVGGAVRDRAPG
jgi:hypothetical protein